MTLLISMVVGVLFAASVYMLLGRELKEVCMGFFLLSHAANLAILEAGRAPGGLFPPVLGAGHPIDQLADPLPQALVLTAIVIGFAVQGFLITLLVVTWRRSGTLDTRELAHETHSDESSDATTEPSQPSEAGASS